MQVGAALFALYIDCVPCQARSTVEASMGRERKREAMAENFEAFSVVR